MDHKMLEERGVAGNACDPRYTLLVHVSFFMFYTPSVPC